MRVNRKSYFWQVWKFFWDLSYVISGGNWIFKWDCVFQVGLCTPLRTMYTGMKIVLDMSHAKNQVHSWRLSWNITKIYYNIAKLLFWVPWAWLIIPTKMIISTSRKVWCLSACKKLTSSLDLSQDNANLLFWILLECLAMAIKNNGVSLKRNFAFIFIQKIKFTSLLFFEILLWYCKLVILGISDIIGQPHQKR